MRKIDGSFPPPHLLKAIRAHACDRPYTRRLLTREEALALPLSRLVEIGTADDIMDAWRTRFALHPGRMAPSRPGLVYLLLLAAAECKRAHQSVRDIVAKLREIEEDLQRRIEEGRQYEAALEERRQRIAEARRCRLLREREDRVQEIEKEIRARVQALMAEGKPE